MATQGRSSAEDVLNPSPLVPAEILDSSVARFMKDDDYVFTSCSFCGAKPKDDDDISDDDFCNAFANSSNRSHVKLPGKAMAENCSSQPIKLKTCTRCKSVAYCSRKCQQKHYHKHKRVCRKIGDFLSELSPDSQATQTRDTATFFEAAPAGNDYPTLTTGGSRAFSNNEGTKVRENNIGEVRYDFKPLPIKGINPPLSHPMTALMEPIDQSFMSQEQYLVVHASPVDYNVQSIFAGVYRLINPTLHVLDHGKTNELSAQMEDSTFNLEALGHSFTFHKLYDMIETPALRFVRNARNELTWCLKAPTFSNEKSFDLVETRAPRARDRKFWNDPYSFLHLHSDDLYGTWSWVHGRGNASICISSLKAVTQAMQFDPSKMWRPTPPEFLKAADFGAWNRNFVLFADHRTSQLPQAWVDLSMGLYKPIKGKIANGYPVWEKHHTLTSELIQSMSGPVKRSLEKIGVMLSQSSREKRFLYVSRERQGEASLLALSESITSDDIILKEICIPEDLDKIVSQSSYFCEETENIFSSWKAFYQGNAVDLHVALIPEESFNERIRFTQNGVELLEQDDSQASGQHHGRKKKSKNGSKKKNSRKKEVTMTTITSNEYNNLDATDTINTTTKTTRDDSSQHADENEGTENSGVPEEQKKPNKKAKKKRKKKSLNPQESSKEDISTDKHSACTVIHHQTTERVESTSNILDGGVLKNETGTSKRLAIIYLSKLASFVEVELPTAKYISEQVEMFEMEESSAEKVLDFLWSTASAGTEKNQSQPLWLTVEEKVTAPILAASLTHEDSLNWIQCNASRMILSFSNKRREELSLLLNAGVSITAASVAALFSSLPKGRGDEFNNKIAKIIAMKCNIILESENDFKLVLKSISHTIGKGTRREITELLKRASTAKKTMKQKSHNEENATPNVPVPSVVADANSSESKQDESLIEMNSDQNIKFTSNASQKIEDALRWYSQLLDDLKNQVSIKRFDLDGGENTAKDPVDDDFHGIVSKRLKKSLNSEEVVAALSTCDTEDALASVETSIDLFQWDGMSCWNIDVTENAHKWFQKHKKKNRALCERVIRRLTLLSTGRWPYVLCKRLKSKSTSCSLYETKVDGASRIIWEVALSFSPRRSSTDQSYCEQVIRVWDIVLDHDNLSRAIEQVIERIEKSHLRGQECALYSEIDTSKSEMIHLEDNVGKLKIPRVFPMRQQVISCTESGTSNPSGKAQHFHPASDDPRQFTLLKFYELNAGAVKMLLDGQDDNTDLPFTPGPKEHEIIHFQSKPQRSILLMGRSGTGKTTCLVFRMWAQYASYLDDSKGPQPNQLFVTKNDVLRREVQRSFKNMGMAWRRRSEEFKNNGNSITKSSKNQDVKLPEFLTSSEWLDILDAELPGERFFTDHERESRNENRKLKDSVSTGVETWLSGGIESEKRLSSHHRQEMTFSVFRKLWRKIRSGTTSQMDSVLVWKEIKSFIKGSVLALQIGNEDRLNPHNRFLSLEEYLSLPRKQSRTDETQRRQVYQLFCNYEKIKKDGGYFDECDLVYNIAGRVTALDQVYFEKLRSRDCMGLLPIDSLFVDEVQDFTQAELFILAKLCRDPNNLFLAGDTAQSIAIGVDFRFTDVRQIFYNNFGGIEPKLLQLSYNYRSHAGVLRLAACVVELLYHFFSNSLDRLPPDLGLFSGPKPVIMEVEQTADLVLMLEGAKRETSRIEFGAHQVVIVRSDDAKSSLPDEFGVDRDWVMTVQESKGLEFDDVLLYNFFTDSPADDLWRVVSCYTEEDIQNYYADVSVASSGVQKYDWQNPILQETRRLDFNAEQHKILETELKMLYTAITRARVNVFIAETNPDRSRPMFNYFQRRCVVDTITKDDSEKLSGVRVFGAKNTVEDWKNRGEYYLQNAEGQRQKGCLRLAAKCFDKAGEIKRKEYAIAFLSFTEMEEKEGTKKRGKHNAEMKEKLYSISEQLLEARDVGFLHKAALCLLRTGAHNEDVARMFELYSQLSFKLRLCKEKEKLHFPVPLSHHEKTYFSYAARLFSMSGKGIDSFRNYVCAGQYDQAVKLLNSGAICLLVGETFSHLLNICRPSIETERDPIASFHRDLQDSENCLALKDALKTAAKAGCRSLSKKSRLGFFAAFSLIPGGNDRIQLLSTVETSVSALLSEKPWSSNELFNDTRSEEFGSCAIDVTELLVAELEKEDKQQEAAAVLEERGFLLKAAERFNEMVAHDDKDNQFLTTKATSLRVKYVELMLLSEEWKEQRENLMSLLSPAASSLSSIPVDIANNCLCSRFIMTLNRSELIPLLEDPTKSILWRFRAFSLLYESLPREEFLESLPGSSVLDRLGFILELATKMIELGNALRCKDKRNNEGNIQVSNAEAYFDLISVNFNQSHLVSNPLTNARLREVAHAEQCSLPLVFGIKSPQNGFKQILDRDKTHMMISNFVHKSTASILIDLNESFAFEEEQISSQDMVSIKDIRYHVNFLQTYLLCATRLKDLSLGYSGHGIDVYEPWVSLKKKTMEIENQASAKLLDILLFRLNCSFSVGGGVRSSDAIVLKSHSIDALQRYSSRRMYDSKIIEKKRNIKLSIINWKVQALCQNEKVATDLLSRSIRSLELHQSTSIDFLKGRPFYVINNKRNIFPRLWLWVVESARSDIMNSISVQERIIKTSFKKGLTPLCKSDQISMLEVNAVALFGALSLTYSEVESPPIWIPKPFLQTYLTGESGLPQLHGFGVPLKNVLLTYCHAHFDKVFEKVVLHLENTAGMILDNDLLSPEGVEDGKAAFFLGVFLCFNAVSFSICGKDMNLQDYRRDSLSSLPSIPIQGNIKKLIAELRKKSVSMLSRSGRCGFLRGAPGTCLDLEFLISEWEDTFAICKMRQLGDEVLVDVLDGTHDFRNVYAYMAIPFHESSDIFEKYAKSGDFLQRVQKRDDEEEQERKSDEHSARRKIAQFIEQYPAKKIIRFDAVVALAHFQHWKLIMKIFIRRMKCKFAKKVPTTTEGDTSADQPGEETRLIFDEITNPLDTISLVSKQKSETIQMFSNAIIDGIECTYCSIVHDPRVQQDRFMKWEIDGRRVPFVSFTQMYNSQEFRSPIAEHPAYHAHIHNCMHIDNVVKYNRNLDNFATVYARLKIGIDLLTQIIYQCDLTGQKGNENASWYLSTAEKGRELFVHLEQHQKQLWDLGMKWSYQPMLESNQYVWIIMQRANELPQHASSFFEEKKLEERTLKERQQEHTSAANETEQHGSVSDVLDLVSGPYLDPNDHS
mmetsp:Transcript_12027/g.24053  ORF Transcript_12027/g.24053 Transcript_12027/m.24053 type:complete len:3243 (+) Transcript_12027:98-9826(+)